MSVPPANFDRLARAYRALEFLAFGRDLERARLCFAGELRDRRHILVLGDGDGRFLSRLAALAPRARIHSVDISQAMLDLAAARISAVGARARVTFERADALGAAFPAGAYDAVATLFFLDCFSAPQVAALEAKVRASLCEGALWLYADFALPPRGVLRWRARAWIRILYLFFGWTASLRVRSLPPSEDILARGGFRRIAARDFQGGLLRSALYDHPAARPGLGSGGQQDDVYVGGKAERDQAKQPE